MGYPVAAVASAAGTAVLLPPGSPYQLGFHSSTVLDLRHGQTHHQPTTALRSRRPLRPQRVGTGRTNSARGPGALASSCAPSPSSPARRRRQQVTRRCAHRSWAVPAALLPVAAARPPAPKAEQMRDLRARALEQLAMLERASGVVHVAPPTTISASPAPSDTGRPQSSPLRRAGQHPPHRKCAAARACHCTPLP
jgi:hypothetical protein